MRAAEDFFNFPNVTLAVLAGGEGIRMGRPKAELQLFDKPILLYILERLNWPGPTLLVTAPTREHPPGWERFDREVADPAFGQGPLRGVLTALETASTPVVICVSVDMPAVAMTQLQFSLEALKRRPENIGMMLSRTSGGETIVEPFPLAIHRGARGIIERRLSAGRPSVKGLLHEPRFAAVEAPVEWPVQVWDNLNRPEDLRAYAGK